MYGSYCGRSDFTIGIFSELESVHIYVVLHLFSKSISSWKIINVEIFIIFEKKLFLFALNQKR